MPGRVDGVAPQVDSVDPLALAVPTEKMTDSKNKLISKAMMKSRTWLIATVDVQIMSVTR